MRRRDVGESDRRVTFLTRELGKIEATAKGARKPSSRFAASTEPLSIARLTLADGKRNRFLTQVEPIGRLRHLREDYDLLRSALALVELYDAVIPMEEESPEAFDLLALSLGFLEQTEKPEATLVWTELRLLELSGSAPSFEVCAITGAAVASGMNWVSPMAGGVVADLASTEYGDRFQVQAEILVGLGRTAPLETPPPKLKYAAECLLALAPFWRALAGTALPANESLLGDLRAELTRTYSES